MYTKNGENCKIGSGFIQESQFSKFFLLSLLLLLLLLLLLSLDMRISKTRQDTGVKLCIIIGIHDMLCKNTLIFL